MQEFSKKTGTSVLLMVVLIVLAIVIAGGGMWYYMNNKVWKAKSELQSQIDALNVKVAERADDTTTVDVQTEDSTTTTVAATDSNATICQQLFSGSKATMAEAAIGDTVCTINRTSGNFVKGSESVKADAEGGPGAAFLAAKVNNAWVKIQSTQDSWDCALLKQYNVPSTVLGSNSECYNNLTGKSEVYQN